MIYIIGSGLSAMAAAVALVRRGCKPVILDAGLTPDSATLTLKERLAATEPEKWNPEDLAILKKTGPVADNGIPRKLHFASDFTFRNPALAAPLEVRHASVHRSFAAGGFSNVWGAVIQQIAKRDLLDWPVTPDELDPHYAVVRALLYDMPEPGSTETPPSATSFTPELRPSSQAQELHGDLATSRHELARQGIRFDYARLAVRDLNRNGQLGCRYCGLCLYGCPYDCRYSAASTLTSLIRNEQVSYLSGVIVDRLSSANGIVRIEARSLAGGARQVFQGRPVLVAAGLLETSRIILGSLGLYDTAIQIQHSDIFTLPMLRFRKTGGTFQEKLHTLCQLVAELEDDAICAHPVHLQFYGYNDLYLELLSKKAGWMAPVLAPAFREAAARLFVVFGYLHSSASSIVKITLSRDGDSTVRLEGQANPEALRISRAVARKLFKSRRYLKGIVLPFQLRLDLPGGGYHSGGIFPMRRTPGSLETDRWGSLASLPGVHLVDASVLPTVPACPLAFVVMANAHRIASDCQVSYGR